MDFKKANVFFFGLYYFYYHSKLHAQTSTLWTLCAALNESYPIRLRPSDLTSWTFIVNKNIHIYVSYLLTIGVIFHLAWNRKWLCGTTKEIFGKKEHK